VRKFIAERSGPVALVLSMVALVLSVTGLGQAAVHFAYDAMAPSTTPHPYGVLQLNKHKQFPASVIPTVNRAKNATNSSKLGNLTASQIEGSCPPTTVDLGSWCLMTAPYPLTTAQQGMNNYFWASQQCVSQGGWPRAPPSSSARRRA
jgi:hypothetical protein